MHRRNFWAGVIGNILDRYDMALYGLMAAFIAPCFFPDENRIVALIKAYGVMAIGFFTRPIGPLIFGRIAMFIGARRVMITCLTGVAICTGTLGLIPSYSSIGTTSTVLFVLVRVLQGIFASGENTVAPFFVLQNSPMNKATTTSGFYNCSTMIGVVVASVCATLVSYSSDPNFYWRYAFVLGFVTAIAGVVIRTTFIKDLEEKLPHINISELFGIVYQNRINVIRVVFVSSFSYITYTIPFVFMNSFIPEVTDIKISEMLQLNSILLVLDTILIPVFAIIAENYDRAKFMSFMSLITALTAIPLFYFISGSNFIYIMFVRLVIILAGLAYLAPIQAYYYNLFKGSERYFLVGIGYSIGEEIFGRNSTWICLWLWYYFGSTVAPAIYITFIALAATIALNYRVGKVLRGTIET